MGLIPPIVGSFFCLSSFLSGENGRVSKVQLGPEVHFVLNK